MYNNIELNGEVFNNVNEVNLSSYHFETKYPEGGSYFRGFSISPLEYRKSNFSKAKVNYLISKWLCYISYI